MNNTNPYNYNLPVDSEMFFGRHSDVATIVGQLTAAHGDSIALIGGRRMGKTSILEAVLRALENSVNLPPGGLVSLPILLDLSGEGIESTKALFETVGAAAHEALTAQLPTPLPLPVLIASTPTVPSFRSTLGAWNRATIAHLGRRLRLILLLDECEEIVHQSWAGELHAALRALLVGQTTRGLLKVVMAGSHRFLSEVHQRGSPLWNVLVYHMLGVFDEQATHELIVQPTEGVLPNAVVQSVFDQSGGHPHLTQYLMYQLWEYGLDRTTPLIVARLAADFPSRRNDFSDWMNGLGETGAVVYRALAQATTLLNEDFLHSHISLPPATLPQTLNALCYHGLTARDEAGNYRVTGQMFHNWFIANFSNQADTHWSEASEDIETVRAQIREKRRRLGKLEIRAARFGSTVDPAISNEIEDIQLEIADLERQLQEGER